MLSRLKNCVEDIQDTEPPMSYVDVVKKLTRRQINANEVNRLRLRQIDEKQD